MVTIKRAAELTGVTEHTIRAWERRYGLVAPSRTAAGYRVYADEELHRIRMMKDLVSRGWTASAAAQSSLRAVGAGLVADSLVDAAAALDETAALAILDAAFAAAPFEDVVDTFLMPALSRLGRAWEDGRVSVAGEHLVSNLVRGRLASAYQAAPAPRSRIVVIGAPPGSEHDLGLIAFAAAARRAGAATIYLGADVPATDWEPTASRAGAAAVVTALYTTRDAARLARVTERLAGCELDLWVGGGQQHRAGAPWRPLGHEIASAARRLADADPKR